jgi:hypothetical protein
MSLEGRGYLIPAPSPRTARLSAGAATTTASPVRRRLLRARSTSTGPSSPSHPHVGTILPDRHVPVFIDNRALAEQGAIFLPDNPHQYGFGPGLEPKKAACFAYPRRSESAQATYPRVRVSVNPVRRLPDRDGSRLHPR